MKEKEVVKVYNILLEKVDQEKSCMDFEDKKGGKFCVCVSPRKDADTKDIIIMRETEKANSVRSTTELANKLMDMGISLETRRDAMDFVSSRLRALDIEESIREGILGPLGGKISKKKGV